MLFFTYFLIASILANVDAVDPCESPQYVVLGESATIQCNFTTGFFGIFWYNTTDYINEYSVLNFRESKISGPGYNSGELDIYPNGSLIITEVTLAHNSNFTVVKLDSAFDEVVPHFVTVVVQAFPTPPYPIIEECHHQSLCAVKVAHHGNLTCSVLGIHPVVELAWEISSTKSPVNLLQTSQHITRLPNGRFDIQLVSEYLINNTSEYSQTVKCRVVSTDGAPTLNLVSEILLLFPDETTSPVAPVDKDDPTDAGSKGLLIFLIVFFLLVAVVVAVAVTVLFLIKRGRGTKYSQPEESADANPETIPLQVTNVTTESEELKTLIAKLQGTYRQIYNATQPIPQIRSENESTAKVFIESDLQSLNFKEGVGKHGIWENVESVEAVLIDPGLGSKKFILEGDHGYIKSTLGIELAYDWCTNTTSSFTKKFEILIYLKLSQLRETSPTFSSLSTMLLGSDKKIGGKNINEILASSSRVGVLLDGFNYSHSHEHVESINVVKLLSCPIFEPFTVILISTPSLLTNIYHFGEIKRLRVIGIDRKTRTDFVTSRVATTTNKSASSCVSGKNENNHPKKGILLTGKKESTDMSSLSVKVTDLTAESGTTDQAGNDPAVSDEFQKQESNQAEKNARTEKEGDFDAGGTSKEKDGHSFQKCTMLKKDSFLPYDLLEIPLFFSVLSKTHTGKVNHQSITTFFTGMIRSLEHETTNKNTVRSPQEKKLTNSEQLHKIAFESITFDKKETKFWNKDDLCEQIGGNFYESCKSKRYFIEEGVDLNDTSESNDKRLKVQVRFSNTFFCEWFAAQHIHHMRASLSKKGKKDWEDLIQKLVSNDYWYCLRFLCGLNPDTADQVLKFTRSREGLQFFCALEKHGSIVNTLDTVKKILSKEIHIRLKDSKLEQMSIIQLLLTAARNQIRIQHLFMEDCFNGAIPSSCELSLRSGLELPILDTLEQLDFDEEGRTLTELEAEAIFSYCLQCSNLKHMSFTKCLLPHNLRGTNLPSNIKPTNLEVEWKPGSKEQSFLFDFENQQWMVMKKKKGKLLTVAEYNNVVKEFNNM